MSIAKDQSNYKDCFDFYDRALASDWGVQRRFSDASLAYAFRSRLNKARALDRERNKQIYEPDHPLHGQSEYGAITIRIRYDDERGVWLCKGERNLLPDSEVEDIPAPEGEIEELTEEEQNAEA